MKLAAAPGQRVAIEIFTTSVVNTVLHYPIIRLRESVDEHESHRDNVRDNIRRILGLR